MQLTPEVEIPKVSIADALARRQPAGSRAGDHSGAGGVSAERRRRHQDDRRVQRLVGHDHARIRRRHRSERGPAQSQLAASAGARVSGGGRRTGHQHFGPAGQCDCLVHSPPPARRRPRKSGRSRSENPDMAALLEPAATAHNAGLRTRRLQMLVEERPELARAAREPAPARDRRPDAEPLCRRQHRSGLRTGSRRVQLERVRRPRRRNAGRRRPPVARHPRTVDPRRSQRPARPEPRYLGGRPLGRQSAAT